MRAPIARDERARLKWKLVSAKGYRFTQLGDTATLRLPVKAPRRHPNGFDMAVLFVLLALSKARDTDTLQLSNVAVLEAMRVPVNSWSRGKVAAALVLWENASFTFHKWMRNREFFTVSMGPPIKRADDSITVDPKWVALLTQGYFERLPLPLPSNTHAQNLYLVLLSKRANDDGQQVRQFTSRRHLTRLIGIEHKRRNEMLDQASEHLAKLFKKRRGWLDADGCDFEFYLP